MQDQKRIELTSRVAHARSYALAARDTLPRALSELTKLAWGAHAFDHPCSVHLLASPHQLCLRLHSGPMFEGLDDRVDWKGVDHLLVALDEATRKLSSSSYAYWKAPFTRADGLSLSTPADLLYLADRGALAVRSQSGLWAQTFEDGWPHTPPFQVSGELGATVGLMIVAALNPDRFPDLPFTREALEDARPGPVSQWSPSAGRIVTTQVEPLITFDWHEQDDLVASCPGRELRAFHPQRLATRLSPWNSSNGT